MRLRQTLESWLARPPFDRVQVRVLGPAPAGIAKVNDRYRYRLTLACTNTRESRTLVAELLRRAQTDKENKGTSIFADVNPLD